MTLFLVTFLPPVDNMIAIMRKGAGRLSELFCTTRLTVVLITFSAHRAVFRLRVQPSLPLRNSGGSTEHGPRHTHGRATNCRA